jgi:hypothetical protein
MWIGAACLLAAAACTAISDFSVHQCEVHADCAHLEGGAWQCEDARCVPGCASNEHCSAADPRTPICSEPGGQCVSLSSADGVCFASTGFDPVSSASLTAKDLRVVGAFAPSVRSSTWLTLKLAVDEIDAAGGVTGASGDRPLVAVLCDDSTDAVDPAMDHLVGELGARAVLGSLGDEPLRAALERSASKGRALFFSPGGADLASASGDPVEQLLWFWGAAYQAVVPVYPALLDRLVMRGPQVFTPDDYRIAIVRSSDREDEHLASAVSTSLSVAGVSSADLERFGRLRTYVLGPDAEVPAGLAEFAPQLVLLFAGGHEPQSPFRERSRVVSRLQELETEVPPFRPIYVLGPRSERDATAASALSSNSEFRARTLLVSADRQSDPGLAELLAARFQAAYPALPANATGLQVSGPVYDATYYLALALDVVGAKSELSASELRTGLQRVSDAAGEAAQLGPVDYAATRALLRGEARVNLLGSSGPAAFDTETQTRAGVAGVRCWDADGTVVERASYEAATGTFSARPAPCAEGLF